MPWIAALMMILLPGAQVVWLSLFSILCFEKKVLPELFKDAKFSSFDRKVSDLILNGKKYDQSFLHSPKMTFCNEVVLTIFFIINNCTTVHWYRSSAGDFFGLIEGVKGPFVTDILIFRGVNTTSV